MKLAILHHHLNRGGVTQVVLNHVRALTAQPSTHSLEILVVHGGRRDGWPEDGFSGNVREAVAPSLDYDDHARVDDRQLAADLMSALQSHGFAAADTVLHVHNHSLGKHVSLPPALTKLAQAGYRMLLQVHDFAEDLRPQNYQRLGAAVAHTEVDAPSADVPSADDIGSYMYPNAPHVHYATLNRRDRDILARAGVPESQLHLLPNPVLSKATPAPEMADAWDRFRKAHDLPPTCRQLVLYPVRAIRRKNIGEVLLWSAVFGPTTAFAITLPATSDAEKPAYEAWKRAADQLKLNVLFDVGQNSSLSFEDNLAAASHIITTSIAEGFGLVFLECWLHHRPLIGRNLPEITVDFTQEGLDLSNLGDSVRVPVHWVGLQTYLDSAIALANELHEAYGRPMATSARTDLYETIKDGFVDFAHLPTQLQMQVVRRLSNSTVAVEMLQRHNPWMRASLEVETREGQVINNRRVAEQSYSLDETGRRLACIYDVVSASRPSEAVTSLPAPAKVLDSFLQVQRMAPIRFEESRPPGPDGAVEESNKQKLLTTIRQLSQPLLPRATETATRLASLPNTRAVIFDIYGTMFVSGAGDITLQTGDSDHQALREALDAVGVPSSLASACTIDGLQAVIQDHHQRSRNLGLAVPEVDIVAVWRDLLWQHKEAIGERRLATILEDVDFELLAVNYECRVNPVWPMPDLVACLAELRQGGLTLGIVSNAQSMTPLLFEALLDASLPQLGFDSDLSFYSYVHGESKPSSRMFDALVDELDQRGISPAEAVYVGNDMLNDVWSAQNVGLKTLLFAGDQRSLRWRETDPRVASIEADGVINQLTSIASCLEVN